MTILVLDDVVRDIRTLPVLSAVVTELLDSFGKEDVNIGIVAEKVSRDQALAAKTLRLANSSFYGLPQKVTTIQQAITILGFDSVRTLIAAAAVTDNFSSSKHTSFDFKTFWRHSIGTALCSKMLARSLNLNENYAFISGLLHDIGKLVLVTRFPQQYAKAIEYRTKHDCYMLEAERTVLDLDHAAVGRVLAQHWKFPLLMQKTIANHHAPATQDLGDIPGIVHIADAIVHALDLTAQEHDLVPVISDAAWKSIRLAPAALSKVFRDTESEFEETCQILVA